MTDLQAILSFTLAAGLLTITPGLDTALVLRTATAKSKSEAFAVALGTGVGCLIWCSLMSYGLGSLLLFAGGMVYDALRFAGAIYLLILGVQMIRKARQHGLQGEDADVAAVTHSEHPLWSAFSQGFLNNILNPKVGAFYVTFLPQFIPADQNISTFGLILGTVHVAEGLLWFALLISATAHFTQWLKQPRIVTRLDRVTGSVLILFGLRLAFEPRHAH